MQSSTITVVGNLTREPQCKVLKEGGVTTSTGVAVNRRWTQKDGAVAESTVFYNVVAWGGLARNAAASLHKGDRVVVIGRLEPREWVDQRGERHFSIEIVADELAPSLRFSCAALERRKPRAEGDSGEPGDQPGRPERFEDDEPQPPMGELDGEELDAEELERLMAQVA